MIARATRGLSGCCGCVNVRRGIITGVNFFSIMATSEVDYNCEYESIEDRSEE